MKHALKHALAAIVLVLSFAAPVAAGPIEDADAAYSKGNYALALRLVRPLADNGDAEAQAFLGVIYKKGMGVPQDYDEAMKWLRLSADQGNVNGQNSLGGFYENGRGVSQDYATAMKWYRRSAEQGDVAGQFYVGSFYALGKGVPVDNVSAYMWFNLSAAQGDTLAGVMRNKIATVMTPAQIAEAQKLAREWKPTKQPSR